MTKLLDTIDRTCVRFNRWYDSRTESKRFLIFFGILCVSVGVANFAPSPFHFLALPILIALIVVRLTK